jgi:hypothetical protein
MICDRTLSSVGFVPVAVLEVDRFFRADDLQNRQRPSLAKYCPYI